MSKKDFIKFFILTMASFPKGVTYYILSQLLTRANIFSDFKGILKECYEEDLLFVDDLDAFDKYRIKEKGKEFCSKFSLDYVIESAKKLDIDFDAIKAYIEKSNIVD